MKAHTIFARLFGLMPLTAPWRVASISLRAAASSPRVRQLEQAQSFDAQVNIINGLLCGEDGGAQGRESDATEVGSGEDESCLSAGSDADQTAAAVKAGGKIDVAFLGEGQTLRTAEAAIPGAGVTVGLDGPDGVIGG